MVSITILYRSLQSCGMPMYLSEMFKYFHVKRLFPILQFRWFCGSTSYQTDLADEGVVTHFKISHKSKAGFG